jgi:hypothetical protein
MYEQVEKPKENKSRAVANAVAQTKSNFKQGFGFVDNRPGSVVQKSLKGYVNSPPLLQRKVMVFEKEKDDAEASIGAKVLAKDFQTSVDIFEATSELTPYNEAPNVLLGHGP